MTRLLQIEQRQTTKINSFAHERKSESGMKINQAVHANIESSEQRGGPLGQQQENENEYEQPLESLETEQDEIGDPIVMSHNQNLEK